MFPVLVVGFALNNLLPVRPGEFARPYWLGRREDLSRTLSFGTILVERVTDGIALIAFLAIALIAHRLALRLPDLAEQIALVADINFGIALGAFGVNETSAADAALAAHSMQYLLITGLGILLAWHAGLSLMQTRDDEDVEMG